MSRRLLVVGERAVYHVVSRVVDRRFIFGEAERARFRALVEGLCGFSGVECLTFCLMSNHFHLLLAVPEAEEGRAGVDDAELFRRLGCIYSEDEVEMVRRRLEELHRESPPLAEAYRERFLRRMFSLPVFVQELKRRFSQGYNREHGRVGALWEERYRSVVVEDGRALAAVAAYIDLNPVRAGLVGEAGRFRWSGWGEALRGGLGARAGLVRVMDPGGSGWGWEEVAEAYGKMLEWKRPPEGEEGGEEAPGGVRSGSGPLAGRVRGFTEGLAVGTRGFLEAVFAAHRGHFGPRRRTGARKLRPGDAGGWGGLACLRDLRSPRPVPPQERD